MREIHPDVRRLMHECYEVMRSFNDPEPMDDRRAVEIVCAIARTLPGWEEE